MIGWIIAGMLIVGSVCLHVQNLRRRLRECR